MTTKANLIDTVTEIAANHGDKPESLLEILHDIQSTVGFVPEECLPTIALRLNVARAEVHGVLSFYHDFRTVPPATVVVKLYRAEACQAMGVEQLAKTLEGSPDVSLEHVYCLGNCALAPAALVNGRLVGRLTPARAYTAVQEAKA